MPTIATVSALSTQRAPKWTMGAGAAVADSTMGAGAAPKSTLGVFLAGNLLEKMRVNCNGAGAEQAQIETEIARGIHA
jgi:hypothetical protein